MTGLTLSEVECVRRDRIFAHNESGFISANDLMWEKIEAEDKLAARIMDMPAHTLRGIAVQARVIACSSWPELESALPGGDGMHDYPLGLLVKLLQSIEGAANA